MPAAAAPQSYDYRMIVNATGVGDDFGPQSDTATSTGSLNSSWTAAWMIRITLDHAAQTADITQAPSSPYAPYIFSTDLGGLHPFTGSDSWSIDSNDTNTGYHLQCNESNVPLSEGMSQQAGYPALEKPWGTGPDHASYVGGAVKLQLLGSQGPGMPVTRHYCTVSIEGAHRRYLTVNRWSTPGIDHKACPGSEFEIPIGRAGEKHIELSSDSSLSCTAVGYVGYDPDDDEVPVGFDYKGRVHYAITLDEIKAPLVVDTTGDQSDINAGDGSCRDSSGKCSLRAAIQESGAGGGSNIAFDIPGGAGVRTITVATQLPKLADGVTIDGATHPGYGTFPLVKVQGKTSFDGLVLGDRDTVRALAVAGFDRGIVIEGTGSTVRNSTIGTNESGDGSQANNTGVRLKGSKNTLGPGNQISNNLRDGVRVTGGANTIKGNLIGVSHDGSRARGNRGNGVHVTSAGNVIGGTVPADRNVISGNLVGVYANGSGATANSIVGNFIGPDARGADRLGNGIGVLIAGGASGDTIGGLAPGAGNLISGNHEDPGIDVQISGSSRIQLAGNWIGPAADGKRFPADERDSSRSDRVGVQLTGRARNNDIGLPGLGNAIGYAQTAIEVTDGSNRNRIRGNLIGMNPAGERATGYAGQGLVIERGATENTVGGAGTSERNVIAGGATEKPDFHADAVTIKADDNTLQGNMIGVDATGQTALGTGGYGVVVKGDRTRIDEGNVISGNDGGGIELDGASHTEIQGNLIGPTAAATELTRPFGASRLGVRQAYGIRGRGDSHTKIGGNGRGAGNLISGNFTGVGLSGSVRSRIIQNKIGTAADGVTELDNREGVELRYTRNVDVFNNVIAFSHRSAITVEHEEAAGNSFSGNSIFENKLPSSADKDAHALGIDLGRDGVTPNTPGSPHEGPNRLQSFPVLAAVKWRGGRVTEYRVTLDSSPDHDFRIELFSSPACDPTGFGQGKTPRRERTVTTNGKGHAEFTSDDLDLTGGVLTATATDEKTGDTSEFSRCLSFSGANVSVEPAVTAPGGSVKLTGSGLQADTAAVVTLRSRPVRLRQLRVGNNGRFSARVRIPRRTRPGRHTITIEGTRAAGSKARVAADLFVRRRSAQ